MTSVQVNIDKEMTSMIKCFRVTDLQELLASAGKHKHGKKSDLIDRVLLMIKTNGSNKAIQKKILELYGRRFPRQASPLKFSSLFNHDSPNGKYLDRPNNNDRSSNSLSKYPEPHQRSDAKIKSLPFYENLSEILPPYRMNFKLNHPQYELSTRFSISKLQASRIYHQDPDNLFKKCIQVQLRFCLLDSATEQDDRFPPDLRVKVNNLYVPLPPPIPPTKAGDPPKQQHRPLDITAICQNIGLHKTLTLSIRWSHKVCRDYVVSINLVRQLPVDKLLEKLEGTGPLLPSVSQALIREKLAKDPESDISTTSLKVSLLCPLGKMRMQLPTRPVECRHLQCFDATLFLKMNERKPTWMCPVCDKPAEFRSLRIDGLFLEILKTSDSDEIDFTEDGNWHCAKKKTEALVNTNKPIDLSQSGQKALEVDSIRKEVDVIDLTGDTSDEEDAPKAPPKSPSRTSNNTPMSVSSSPGDFGLTKLKNGHLDMTSSNPHLSSYRKSPQQKISSKPYLSPASSPYCKSESPLFKTRNSHNQTYSQAKPYDLSAGHTPSKQTSLPSQYSPFSYNGRKDPSPNLQIPSPFVASTPPTVLPPFPNLDFGLDRYSPNLNFNTPLNDPSFLLRLPHPSPLEFLNQRYLLNHGTSSINPYLLQSQFSLLNSYNMSNLPHSSGASVTDSRSPEFGLSTPRLDISDELNFNQDSID